MNTMTPHKAMLDTLRMYPSDYPFTNEARAQIRLAELGFTLGCTPTGHQYLIDPDGRVSVQSHGSYETAMLEAERIAR